MGFRDAADSVDVFLAGWPNSTDSMSDSSGISISDSNCCMDSRYIYVNKHSEIKVAHGAGIVKFDFSFLV